MRYFATSPSEREKLQLLRRIQFSVYSLQCMVFSVCIVQCDECIFLNAVYNIMCGVNYTVKCTLHCTMYVHYTEQCAPHSAVYTTQCIHHYTMQCTLHSAYITTRWSVHMESVTLSKVSPKSMSQLTAPDSSLGTVLWGGWTQNINSAIELVELKYTVIILWK